MKNLTLSVQNWSLTTTKLSLKSKPQAGVTCALLLGESNAEGEARAGNSFDF